MEENEMSLFGVDHESYLSSVIIKPRTSRSKEYVPKSEEKRKKKKERRKRKRPIKPG
jgi:hypothetical protein